VFNKPLPALTTITAAMVVGHMMPMRRLLFPAVVKIVQLIILTVFLLQALASLELAKLISPLLTSRVMLVLPVVNSQLL